VLKEVFVVLWAVLAVSGQSTNSPTVPPLVLNRIMFMRIASEKDFLDKITAKSKGAGDRARAEEEKRLGLTDSEFKALQDIAVKHRDGLSTVSASGNSLGRGASAVQFQKLQADGDKVTNDYVEQARETLGDAKFQAAKNIEWADILAHSHIEKTN
jgi:hypothetical protein